MKSTHKTQNMECNQMLNHESWKWWVVIDQSKFLIFKWDIGYLEHWKLWTDFVFQYNIPIWCYGLKCELFIKEYFPLTSTIENQTVIWSHLYDDVIKLYSSQNFLPWILYTESSKHSSLQEVVWWLFLFVNSKIDTQSFFLLKSSSITRGTLYGSSSQFEQHSLL